MSQLAAKLRVINGLLGTSEQDLAVELFHRINKVIPENQDLFTFPPTYLVCDAIPEMIKRKFSQVPVLDNNEVLGVFSFRSFSKGVANVSFEGWKEQKCAPSDLQVDDFLEQFQFARVTDEMNRVFGAMQDDNGVLVGDHEKLIGILTPMDFLLYLYQVANPFVMISEIELAVRAIIRSVLTPDQIKEVAKRCLSKAYNGDKNVPENLEEMNFTNYQVMITHSETWVVFESLFGGTRARMGGKLREIAEIRNNVFHFKRNASWEDHEKLSAHRNWFLNKIKQSDAKKIKDSGR